ncbi:hypothetical protein K505DRAFT_323777 [Melanomma pulvis-pyrius CBS 109.77]|uniref:RNA polymerase sigma factor 70 region 4 type 2 domain-containing protein n=1 Tax=Melanomma pulvis-pyrius CBS 109.77 TaxID=1314802 RepID=A0A6A6XHK2_9PLEO|nr:hypothetical protein K505DRAFT_323777 [Melanomma pulvis-pyrius CBS 109.77]
MPSSYSKRAPEPKGPKNLTEGQKAAIITLREACNLTYPEISTKLGVTDAAAGQAYRKAKREAQQLTGSSECSLSQLIAAAKPKPHSGRPAKAKVGCGSVRRSESIADFTLCN